MFYFRIEKIFNRLSFFPSSFHWKNIFEPSSFHSLFTFKKFSMIHPPSIQIWQNHPKGTKPFSHISTSLLFIKLSFLLSFFFFSFHLIYSPPSRQNFLSEQRIQEVARFLFPLPRFFPPRIVHAAALQRRNFSSLWK